MQTIHIVVVDNGDTEHELWAFESEVDAARFAEVRSDGAYVVTVTPLGGTEAAEAIADEEEGY